MARNDALLRLHDTLVGRRGELLRRLGGELQDLRYKTSDTGDAADQAFDSGAEEVSSQIAQLESRELNQIDKALRRLKAGTYGVCEGCQKKIPVTRLSALPFTTTCIGCQREMEQYGEFDRSHRGDWGGVDSVTYTDDTRREVRLSDLEANL